MKSLSEIETVSKRASRAAGYSWGICEEVGKNVRLLEMFGLPGIKNLNDYFDKKKKQKFENLKLINAENKFIKLQYCPIISGTSLLDQIKSLGNLNEIKFEGIAYPLLFLPFVSRASEVIGKKLQLEVDSKIFLLNYNNSMSVQDNEVLVKITSAGTISIPKQFRKYMDVQKGEYVKLILENDTLVVRKITIS